MTNIFKIRRKKDLQGKEIDYNNCWTIDKLRNKEGFLKRIIELVPNGSIWAIEGISKELIEYFSEYHIIDDQKTALGTIWPKQRLLKIKIDTNSRDLIVHKLSKIDLSQEIIHQHIYYGDKFYLTSFDNLHKDCTWISKDFKRLEFEDLIKNGEL